MSKFRSERLKLGSKHYHLGQYSQSPRNFATMQIYCLAAYTLFFTGCLTKDLLCETGPWSSTLSPAVNLSKFILKIPVSQFLH
jgi:hypothetical protein